MTTYLNGKILDNLRFLNELRQVYFGTGKENSLI